MDIVIVARDRADAVAGAEQLRVLREWLLADRDLRGRVRPRQASVPVGAMGPVLDGLTVASLGGALARSVASVVVTFPRSRTSEVEVTVTGAGGASATVNASQVKGVDQRGIETIVGQLIDTINGSPSSAGDHGAGPGAGPGVGRSDESAPDGPGPDSGRSA
jgi:hypothetical protein